MEQTCLNCKHKHLSPEILPCGECMFSTPHFSKWESDGEPVIVPTRSLRVRVIELLYNGVFDRLERAYTTRRMPGFLDYVRLKIAHRLMRMKP